MSKIKLYKTIIITISLVLTAALVFFFRHRFRDKDNFQDSISNNQISNTEQIQNSKQNSEANELTYTNQKYGFSFTYPAELNIAEFEEAGGDMVLAQSGENNQDTRNNNQNAGFQIFIIPFDEEGTVTPERIKQDLPEMEINKPQNVIIGKDNIKALIFFGQEPEFDKTREVWFIHNGYLYQVFAPAELEEFIIKVMESWSFQ